MGCDGNRCEEISGENADGKMVEDSESHELGREKYLGKRVSAPKHEFPVPKNEIPSIRQKVVGVLFRCQKISYL